MNIHSHTLLALVLSGILMLNSTAYAQNTEAEPNQTCSTAQNVGTITLPFTQQGYIDNLGDIDIDYFRFTGTPGELVKVDLEGEDTAKGSLDNPNLSFFDSSCNWIASNEDNGETLNSRLILTIPSDGVFILSATTYFLDWPGSEGSYQMTIGPFTPNVKISGQVIDALFGDPLPGYVEPFANIELNRCDDSGCNYVNDQAADSEGRFRFTHSYSGFPLEAGTYQIVANANQYQSGQTDQITLVEGEDRNVGDVLLQPFPAQISDVLPCDNVPSKGGVCRYSVKVTNHLTTPFYGRAWSVVTVGGTNSFIGSTTFQVKTEPLKLKSHKGTKAQFYFSVPTDVPDDAANICTSVYVGQYPHAFVNTVGYKDLFCITKGNNEFKVMSEKKAQEMFRQMNGKTKQPSTAKKK